MKGQSFHQRKIKLPDAPKLDRDELRARTITALHKLGEQKFSEAPGGYSLENWIHGVNVLLDDFEEKMGASNLSSEYTQSRRLLAEFVSKPVDVSSLDGEISGVRQRMAEIEGRFDESRAQIRARVDDLKREQAAYSDELAREQKKLAEAPVEQNSGSFLKRLFRGNSDAPMAESKAQIEELESKLRVIPDQILDQHKLMRSIDDHSPDSPLANEWRELEALRTKFTALGSERLERTELVKERADLTSSVARAISEMPPAKAG